MKNHKPFLLNALMRVAKREKTPKREAPEAHWRDFCHSVGRWARTFALSAQREKNCLNLKSCRGPPIFPNLVGYQGCLIDRVSRYRQKRPKEFKDYDDFSQPADVKIMGIFEQG
jgi:hypothetical protein